MDFDTRVREIVGADRVRVNAALAPLTTFKVGGAADWLIDVASADELRGVLMAARETRIPVTVLGGGSNVLVSDDGVRGAVLRLRLTVITQVEAGAVRAAAGVTINGLARWTIARGLGGVEAWAGTPGTVGGAIFGNAHYGGRNLGDLVRSVQLVTSGGESIDVPAAEMEFAYDTSRLKRTREILVSADFTVAPASPETLRLTARASLAHRKRTQPLETPSAGCIFQNPDPSIDSVPAGIPPSAGALVDRAGLKGRRIGGACISSTHANFFVNDEGATARDIRALIDLARSTVRSRFGVELRDEIVYLGDV